MTQIDMAFLRPLTCKHVCVRVCIVPTEKQLRKVVIRYTENMYRKRYFYHNNTCMCASSTLQCSLSKPQTSTARQQYLFHTHTHNTHFLAFLLLCLMGPTLSFPPCTSMKQSEDFLVIIHLHPLSS